MSKKGRLKVQPNPTSQVLFLIFSFSSSKNLLIFLCPCKVLVMIEIILPLPPETMSLGQVSHKTVYNFMPNQFYNHFYLKRVKSLT